MSKLKNTLEKVLKEYPVFVDSESGDLNYIKIKDFADKVDGELISLLADNKELREKFFTKIKDIYVFNIQEFKFFLDESKIDNSYTQYTNKIGLADSSGFLENRSEVVLDFPFKDCILEGGQSTEEGTDTYFEYSDTAKHYEEKTAKRKEIFFNHVLAHDEIDRLLDKKALVNWKRFTKDSGKEGEEVKEIKRDKTGVIQENLIIKGNNLLALHSLKSEFTEKIKLIYIDPPYNTGGDSNIFSYNNNFNHSTWLTFMKNRLDIAKDLLTENGFITIAIDHAELFYLGALADEVFKRDNRIGIITVLHNPKGRNQAKFLSENSEFLLIYAKDKTKSSFNNVAISDLVKESFTEQDEEGSFRYEEYMRARTVWSRENRPKNWYPIYVSKDLKDITHEKKDSYYEVFPITNNGKEMAWKNVKDTFVELNHNGYFVAKKENEKIIIYHKYREQQVIKNVWTDKKYQSEFQGTNLLKKIIGENEFSYPKSIYAVLDIIKIMTDKDDIVLDYHAGSGTTGHAVLELNKEAGNRKFILVEQLDEHIDICNKRLVTVIKEDKINDSFIYLELAKWNEEAKEEIENAKDLPALIKLFDGICEKYFLNYNVKIKDFKEKIIKEEEFKNITLIEQKKMILSMLDLNQMYVQESEMSDKRYGISSKDQQLTKDFYSKE
jgi:adenine-specific DNA-methyltransferase